MSKFEESKIQEDIIKRFNQLVQHNQLDRLCVLYSNRNENNHTGLKAQIQGAKYNRMGRLKGVPDLSLIIGGIINYIEVKTPKVHRTSKGVETKSKGMSEEQIKFHDTYIVPMKIRFAVVSSVADFENFIWFLKKQ